MSWFSDQSWLDRFTILDRWRRPDCHVVMQVLQQFLDGELGGDDVAFVEAHLAECDRCNVEAAVYRRVKQRLEALRRPTDQAAVARLEASAERLMAEGPDLPA